MLFGFDLKTWLALSVVGAIIATLGSLLGIVIKDFFFARSFERWKQRQTLEQLYQKFRDPLILATCELTSRVIEVLNHFPTVYLTDAVLASRPDKQVENSINDPYFRRYKLVSTAYRASALLAWIELYRQEVTHLHPGNNKHARSLESVVAHLRSDFADGQLNTATDWDQWKDTLVFREELRAIGESLIESRGSTRTVMGYGRYCECSEATTPNVVQRWAPVMFNFFLEFRADGRDFRLVRLQRLLGHLVELIRLLDKGAVESYMEEACRRHHPDERQRARI